MRQIMKAARCALIVSATIAAAGIGCNRQQLGSVNTALLLSSYSTTNEPASFYFCGNHRKSPPGSVCMSNALDAAGNRLAARERVEIRGWIIDSGIFCDSDNPERVTEEYCFSVLLDHAWTAGTPANANVFPLNTSQRIAGAITPHNAIHFGVGDGGIGSARLDASGMIWGGAGAVVIHIEVDAWFERGRMPPRCQPSPSTVCNIADWSIVPDAPTPGLYWPFNPHVPPGMRSGPLQLGDYVRLVGTLWEDTAHLDDGGNGGDLGEEAKACWCRRATGNCKDSGRGWFELHPVDYMARIDPPTTVSATIDVLALCGGGSVSRQILPPGPKPTPGSTIGFERFPDAVFTDTTQVVETVTVLPNALRVDLTARPGSGDRARFKAVYRVFWRNENGQTLPGPARPVLPTQPFTLLSLERDRCNATALFIETPRPRRTLARGESSGFSTNSTTLEWSCGPRTPGQPLNTIRCPATTFAVKVTRNATGDEVVTECIGPK